MYRIVQKRKKALTNKICIMRPKQNKKQIPENYDTINDQDSGRRKKKNFRKLC